MTNYEGIKPIYEDAKDELGDVCFGMLNDLACLVTELRKCPSPIRI